MIELDSSHPFDWDAMRQSAESEVRIFRHPFGWTPAEGSVRDLSALDEDVVKLGRVIPLGVRVLLETDFDAMGVSHGLCPILVSEIVRMRAEQQELDGVGRYIGEAFVPLFYLGSGATIAAYLPKQVEPCADSFAVAYDERCSGWEFLAFSSVMLLMLLGKAIVPRTYDHDLPPILKEWMS